MPSQVQKLKVRRAVLDNKCKGIAFTNDRSSELTL